MCKVFGKYVDRSLIYRLLRQTDATRVEVCISKPDLIELIESWNVFFFPSVFHVSDWKPSTFHSLNSFLDSFRGHSKSKFGQDSRVLTHSSPLVRPCSFWSNKHPPPLLQKVSSFWPELNLSLSIWISILVKCREKKLIMSTSIFGWTQLVF